MVEAVEPTAAMVALAEPPEAGFSTMLATFWPLIVNDLFLKKPGRIETLGAIILIALLVWNLIEHVLRQYVIIHDVNLPGWDNKKTRRPTSFMMSTKFMGIQIIRIGCARRLARPLSDVQFMYLKAMGLTEQSLLMPLSMPRPG